MSAWACTRGGGARVAVCIAVLVMAILGEWGCCESRRVDCTKFVFAPRCRGVAAKRMAASSAAGSPHSSAVRARVADHDIGRYDVSDYRVFPSSDDSSDDSSLDDRRDDDSSAMYQYLSDVIAGDGSDSPPSHTMPSSSPLRHHNHYKSLLAQANSIPSTVAFSGSSRWRQLVLQSLLQPEVENRLALKYRALLRKQLRDNTSGDEGEEDMPTDDITDTDKARLYNFLSEQA